MPTKITKTEMTCQQLLELNTATLLLHVKKLLSEENVNWDELNSAAVLLESAARILKF